jgi:CheY-like chemotaxis protein
MLRHVFQEYGATVELAASVMEALEHLNETVHDVIISDIGRPNMDGYQLLRRVRSLDAKITAVAVTAFSDSETECEPFKQVTICMLPSRSSHRNSKKQ